MRSATPIPAPCGGTRVPLKQVERELNRQLKCIQENSAEAPVVRSGLSNLVIYCDGEANAAEVEREIPQIVAIHPARVLLLIHDADAPAGPVEATVLARHFPGKGPRAFSEQITIRAGGRAGEHLPYAVRSLVVGDLPTNLWWAAPTPPPLAGPLLDELSDDVDQVLYDSFGWPQPARGMKATASWLDTFERGPGQGHFHYRVASDLTWRRLKSWRRVLSEALDPATAPGALGSITNIHVEHGPHSVMIAWSLASWLVQGLGWTVSGARVQPGVEIDWRFTCPEGPRHVKIRRLGEGPRGIRHIQVDCHIEGAADRLHVVPECDGRRLSVDLENDDLEPRTVTTTPQPIADLVARQLSDRERDPVFRRTMHMAESLAKSVIGA